MPDDNPYDDGGSAPAPVDSGASHQESQDQDYGQTAVIPKELCPDMNVGDEVVLRIVRGNEDSWEVAYAPDDQHKEGGDKSDPTSKGDVETGGADEGSMASMME